MVWTLVIQTLTFRAVVLIIDYLILAVVLQRPVEAGLITIIRHSLYTVMYWGHEVVWLNIRLRRIPTVLVASRRHTILKAISFRAISLTADLILLGVLTGSVWASSLGAVLIAISNTVIFYFHDRWWEAWKRNHAEKMKALNEPPLQED
jgi:uncharacterized membrane protein